MEFTKILLHCHFLAGALILILRTLVLPVGGGERGGFSTQQDVGNYMYELKTCRHENRGTNTFIAFLSLHRASRYKGLMCTDRCTYLLVLESIGIYIRMLLHASVCESHPALHTAYKPQWT